MLDCPPDGVFLVACLIPTGRSQWTDRHCSLLSSILSSKHSCNADKAKLPRNRSFLIAGLAAVSFNSATREQMPTLQPPDTAAYLSNIAVAPQFRRYCLTRFPLGDTLTVSLVLVLELRMTS